MTNIILFGPPGSGKGTQAQMLEKKYDLIHISTGDLFRYEMGNDTPLGLKAKEYMSKGMLVPDEVTIGMLKNKMDNHHDANGFIFDGFPRTIPQAEALDKILESLDDPMDGLIALDVEKDEIVQRILKRAETSGRADDADPEIIENRIKVYLDETKPVESHYQAANKVYKVNGLGTIEEIFDRLCAVIDTL